jgi:hypothetical protein
MILRPLRAYDRALMITRTRNKRGMKRLGPMARYANL